jgi:DNA-damage-inducible protein J
MDTSDTTIQVRIDAKTKRESKKIFESAGIDMSTAIKLFLRSTVRRKSVSAELLTVNGYTPEFEAMLIAESKEALKNGKKYTDLDELFKDLGIYRK